MQDAKKRIEAKIVLIKKYLAESDYVLATQTLFGLNNIFYRNNISAVSYFDFIQPCIDTITSKNIADPMTHMVRAVFCERAGKDQEALSIYGDIEQKYPAYTIAYFYHAGLLEKHERYVDAIVVLAKIKDRLDERGQFFENKLAEIEQRLANLKKTLGEQQRLEFLGFFSSKSKFDLPVEFVSAKRMQGPK